MLTWIDEINVKFNLRKIRNYSLLLSFLFAPYTTEQELKLLQLASLLVFQTLANKRLTNTQLQSIN